MAHDRTALLIAEEDEEAEDDLAIVGSVIATWDGWRRSIYRLLVAPSHRRQGLACRPSIRPEAR